MAAFVDWVIGLVIGKGSGAPRANSLIVINAIKASMTSISVGGLKRSRHKLAHQARGKRVLQLHYLQVQ